MLVTDLLPDWQDWDICIFGTDINPFALRRARLARFGDWSFRGVDDETIAKYFRTVGARTRFLLHPCRDLVTFLQHNLAIDPVPDREHGLVGLDVILCRNVTIYFDDVLTRLLADGFRSALAPGGWLLVGHAEPDPAVFGRFEAVEFAETIVYRVPGGASRTVEPALPAARGLIEPTVDSEKSFEPSVPEMSEPRQPTLAEARAAYDAHDHVGAFELLVAIAGGVEADPTSAHLLAQLSADEKRYDEALYWAFRALLLDRFHVPTLMLMALIWLERSDPIRAREFLQHAIFNNPTAPEAHLYLSMAHRALGNPEQAERSRDRAVRLARSHVDEWSEANLLPVERPRIGLAED
jgi:chemotaxis protein methyltransferase CheR